LKSLSLKYNCIADIICGSHGLNSFSPPIGLFLTLITAYLMRLRLVMTSCPFLAPKPVPRSPASAKAPSKRPA